MYIYIHIIYSDFSCLDSLIASLWIGRVWRDGYRDQIVIMLHCVMWVCIPVSELVCIGFFFYIPYISLFNSNTFTCTEGKWLLCNC